MSPSPRPVRRRLRLPVVVLALAALVVPGAARADDPALTTRDTTEHVAPGIELRELTELRAGGWTDAHVLEVDLGQDGVDVEALTAPTASSTATIRSQAAAAGAVAAINADFFAINNSNASVASDVVGGDLVAGTSASTDVVSIGQDGLGRLADLALQGSVGLPGGDRALTELNHPSVATDGIGAYTSFWGSYPRASVAAGAQDVHEVLIRGGRVVASSATPGTGTLPRDVIALVGREAGGRALAALQLGDRVAVDYAPRTSSSSPLRVAVGGGSNVLVRDGAVVETTTDGVAARAAIGFDATGRHMLLVTVDGKLANVPGLTRPELAELLVRLGADDALNVDGGGSATLVTRPLGLPALSVRNVPSDGAERPVPVGLGLFSAPGDGRVHGLRVRAVGSERVLAGLRRRLTAGAYDDREAPVADATPAWSADAGQIDDDGVLTAPGTAGAVTVHARQGAADATLGVQVLGRAATLAASPLRLAFPDADAPAQPLTITGSDAEGYDAPVDRADLTLEYDRSVVSVTQGADGALRVAPVGRGSTVLEVATGDVRTRVAVTVGLDDQLVSGFEDATAWTFNQARAAGTATATPDGHTGAGVRVDFDFTQSTATRTAGLTPAQPLTLGGQPRALSWWVKSDGQGEWTSATIVDAAGKSTNLYGPYLTTPGWTRIEQPLPASGVQYPVRLASLRVIETAAARSYTGSVTFDDLVARVPPSVDVPEAPLVRDPIVDADGVLPDGRWTFATLSDIQFTANDTALDRDLLEIGRTDLRQIVAERPDLLLLNGDIVDTGFPKDMALARSLLDQELSAAPFPWYYVPGNHEYYGANNLDAFKASISPQTSQTFDHRGVRFVLLNSSAGTLRGSDVGQLAMLRGALDDAARDPSVKDVVVAAHHPVLDPDPAEGSELGDRREAALVDRWLGDFHAATGKGVLMIGSHAQIANARRHDGVRYVVLPSAGKSPYGTPDRGGFNGRATFAVDTSAGDDWIVERVRPDVDRIDLAAPATLAADATADVTATAIQRGTRRVPLRYPASVRWTGDHVAIAPAAPASGDLAVFDPASGRLRALGRAAGGPAVLRVQAGGVSQETPIAVAAAPSGTAPVGVPVPRGSSPSSARADRTAPRLGAVRLRVTGRSLLVRLAPDEAVRLRVTVRVGGRRLSRTVNLQRGARSLRLLLPRSARGRTAAVTLRASDRAGNARTRSLHVRVGAPPRRVGGRR